MVRVSGATEVLVYGVDDVRRALTCGRPTAYRLVKRLGRRIGRRFVVSKLAFEAWLLGEPVGRSAAAGPRRYRKAAQRVPPRQP
jgi:hypothetical protein